MKYFIFLLFIAVGVVGCKKEGTGMSASESYLPMAVGNYWRINNENYTEIVGTQMISGKLYYKFYSRIGGDVVSTSYYRIDGNNSLIEQFPDDPSSIYTKVKFNDNVGDGFYANDGKNGYYIIYVTMTKKEDNIITVASELTNHPNLKGQKDYQSFKKGFGFVGNWKEVKIGDKLYRLL